MELQFMKSNIRALNNALWEVKAGELTQEVRLADAMPDIGRVLMSWGQVMLRSKEWNRDQIRISGGVMVHTCYLPEDGSEIRSVDSWLPFQMNWNVDPDSHEGQILALPLLRNLDSRNTSARKILLRGDLSCLVKALSPVEAAFYQAENIPEDVQLLKRTYPVRIPREAGEKTFLQDEELTIPETAPKMEKLLAYTLRPEITEKRVTGNRMVFKGKGNLHLVYRCPEGKVHSMDFELPFSQFSELDRSYEGETGVELFPAVTNLEVELMNPQMIRLKDAMVCQYLVDELQMINVAQDAYSPFREVKASREDLAIPSILEDRREMLTAAQGMPGVEGQPVQAQFLPDFPQKKRKEDKMQLQIPGTFQLLYEGENGALQMTTTKWEHTMELPLGEGAVMEAAIQSFGPVATVNGMDALEVSSPLRLDLRTQAETEIPMITALELGELREPDPGRPSILLTRAGEEDLWSIAKRTGSTMEAIRKSNDFTGEPSPDQMLLIEVI